MLLVTLAVVLEDEDVNRVVKDEPDTQVDEEYPHGSDLHPYTQNRSQHNDQRHNNQNGHGPAGTETRAKELVMDMVLVRQEGIMMITQTDDDHAHDI